MEKPTLRPKIKRKKIVFTLEADDAKEVHLVGEFNDWKAGVHPMKNKGNGKWVKQLMLPEGTFEYKFLVDNQWRSDPQNERWCLNCFGTRNSIVRVILG
jgi:1,4-alpha-glucan branching enzyme